MSKVVTLENESQWESLVNGEKPVLAKFGAQWCGPCQMIAPFMEKKAEEEGRVVIVSVDIDDFPALEEKYEVSNLPTYVLLSKGNEVGRTFGVKEDKINELIAKAL